MPCKRYCRPPRSFSLWLVAHGVIQGMQAAQSAACNRLHGIQQRLARWLLIMQDRTNEGCCPYPPICLATMAGPTASVSLQPDSSDPRGHRIYTGCGESPNRKKLEEYAWNVTAHQQFNGALGFGDLNVTPRAGTDPTSGL